MSDGRLLCVLALAAACLASSPCGAETFVVTKTADTNDGVCDADCSLREAVRAANATSEADTIVLPAGVFPLAIAGQDEDQAASGDLDLTQPVTIRGAGRDRTVIDALGNDRVLQTRLHPGDRLLRDLTLRGGRLSEQRGCGVWVSGTTTLLLARVRITDNRCVGASPAFDNGGGIHVDYAATLLVAESLLDANFAERGGAIYAQGSAVEIYETTIAGNEAAVSGGGLSGGGSWTVVRSTLSGNRAGAASFFGAASDARFFASTLSGNQGWAIRSDGAVALDNVTIVGTAAFWPLQVFAGGMVTLRNTLVVNPIFAGGSECQLAASATSLGYNLLGDESCGAGPLDRIETDPGLRKIGWYGGLTRTHLPRPGSPAIDAGAPGACPDSDGAPSLEQRRFERILDGDGIDGARCDIGAVEYAPEADGVTAAALALLALRVNRRRRQRRIARAAANDSAASTPPAAKARAKDAAEASPP
jgi:CSLREA domain-containing protein